MNKTSAIRGQLERKAFAAVWSDSARNLKNRLNREPVFLTRVGAADLSPREREREKRVLENNHQKGK